MSTALEEEFDASPAARRPWDKPKARHCLRCDTRFMSAWSGERICPRCKGSSAWRNDAPLPHKSVPSAR